MALYEAVFIARQDLTAESIDTLSDKLSDIITNAKGKVVSKEYWGLRDLAYKINKNAKGHYFLLNIESENAGIEELRRVSGLNEDVVRSNIFKVEEHTKDQSGLAVSVNAKDFKPSESGKKDNRSNTQKALDTKFDKIVINA